MANVCRKRVRCESCRQSKLHLNFKGEEQFRVFVNLSVRSFAASNIQMSLPFYIFQAKCRNVE